MRKLFNIERLDGSVLYANFEGNKTLFAYSNTFMVGQLIEKIKVNLGGVSKEEREYLFGDGISCQVLQPGSDWIVGKLKIRIEFIPDEVDSPLDDIRQAIADNDQSG